jgi:hypothetical protein
VRYRKRRVTHLSTETEHAREVGASCGENGFVCLDCAADAVDRKVCGVVVEREDWVICCCGLLDWCLGDWYLPGDNARNRCDWSWTQFILLRIQGNDN